MKDGGVVYKRRRWKRYKLARGAVVLLHRPRLLGRSRPIQLGAIVDLCMGGLKAQYVEGRVKDLDDFTTLSIAIPSEGIELSEFSFKTVDDRRLASVSGEGHIRTRSVKFVQLTPFQKYQLEIFLRTFGLNGDESPPQPSALSG